MDATYVIGELIALGTMAVALSMDAFSVGLGMGMYRLRLKHITLIGVTIGFFHMMMPLFGMVIGKLLSVHFGKAATIVGGLLLLFLGIEMIRSSFHSKRDRQQIAPFGVGLFFFSLSVSLDSFSVGLSLGIFGARVVVTLILFGIASTVLTWLGLLLGRKFRSLLGNYSEAFGGCILFAFGLKLLLPF